MTSRSTHDQVRRAVPDDAEELTRLRALMFRDMGRPADLLDEAWSRRNVEHFRARLADTESFAAFVVDQPDAGLAAVAVGWLDQHLIGPTNPSGQVGYIANICTDSAFRRRGYSRSTLTALLDWLRSRDIRLVNLHASEDGANLYKSMGFTESTETSLTLHLH